MKILLTLFLLLLFAKSNAATFNSSGMSTNWSLASSWIIVNGFDTDKIPDKDDDITILNTHTITITASSNYVRSIKICDGATFNTSNNYLFLCGNFTNNGKINDSLYFVISNSSVIISSATILNVNYFKITGSIVTLFPNTQINLPKDVSITLKDKSTFNNNGILICSGINTSETTGNIFNNFEGASLLLNKSITDDLVFNSSVNSTVILNKEVCMVPDWTYYNLILKGEPSFKNTKSELYIHGDLTIGNDVVFDASLKSIYLKGNLLNYGAITNLHTIYLTGTSVQVIRTSSELHLYTLISTNQSTVILSEGTFNIVTNDSFTQNFKLSDGVVLNVGKL